MLGKVTVVSSDFERHKEFKSGKELRIAQFYKDASIPYYSDI